MDKEDGKVLEADREEECCDFKTGDIEQLAEALEFNTNGGNEGIRNGGGLLLSR
jgi:hypothetical protein